MCSLSARGERYALASLVLVKDPGRDLAEAAMRGAASGQVMQLAAALGGELLASVQKPLAEMIAEAGPELGECRRGGAQ